MSFSDNLIAFRKQRGLSQQELGDKVDINKRIISRYETGQTIPSVEVAIKLAEALSVSLDRLAELDFSLFIDDPELTSLLRNYDSLPPEDQATVKKLLKAFSVYSKIERTQQEISS